MKKYFLIFLVLFIYGCSVDPELTEKTSNNNIKLDLLFEKDGCKIYRFKDAGHYIYWTNCGGNISRGNISWTQSSGKGTKKYQNETVEGE